MCQHNAIQPLDKVAFDYVGPLPETLGHKRFIIVAIDVFTKFVDLKAVGDQTGKRLAKYLNNFIWGAKNYFD